MAILVATTSLPAVYRPNGYAQTTTAGTLHARAKKKAKKDNICLRQVFSALAHNQHFIIASY